MGRKVVQVSISEVDEAFSAGNVENGHAWATRADNGEIVGTIDERPDGYFDFSVTTQSAVYGVRSTAREAAEAIFQNHSQTDRRGRR